MVFFNDQFSRDVQHVITWWLFKEKKVTKIFKSIQDTLIKTCYLTECKEYFHESFSQIDMSMIDFDFMLMPFAAKYSTKQNKKGKSLVWFPCFCLHAWMQQQDDIKENFLIQYNISLDIMFVATSVATLLSILAIQHIKLVPSSNGNCLSFFHSGKGSNKNWTGPFYACHEKTDLKVFVVVIPKK